MSVDSGLALLRAKMNMLSHLIGLALLILEFSQDNLAIDRQGAEGYGLRAIIIEESDTYAIPPAVLLCSSF